MSAFLDDFGRAALWKKDSLKSKVSGDRGPLSALFGRRVGDFWVGLKDLNEFSVDIGGLNIVAVDSSVYRCVLSNSGVFYVVGAMAFRRDVVSKKVETDIVFTRRLNYFLELKMEMLEFEVALEALKGGFDGDAILIDGSLFGRAVHVLRELDVEGEHDLLLRYYSVYGELLDACRRSGVLLVGVSKESRSTFYRDYLLSLIYEEELSRLNVTEEDKGVLRKVFSEALWNEGRAFKRYSELERKYGKELGLLGSILRELVSPTPDYQLIMSHVSSAGYLRPLALGPSIRVLRRFMEYRKDRRAFVEGKFPKCVRDRGEEFIGEALKVLDGVLGFPSLASFYLLLDKRDSPMRVDVPYYAKSFFEVKWPEPVELDGLNDILKILVTGYAGLTVHNVWLKNVDDRVKLRKREVDNVYFPLLENLLGAKIVRGRRDRRVRFP